MHKMMFRVTDEGSVPEIAQYGPYCLLLNIFTVSKGSNFNILLTMMTILMEKNIVVSIDKTSPSDTVKHLSSTFQQDIFRKYPNKYESIIATLCENLDTLDEPEARASMIWIIGEYAERIDNADELLESFLEGFQDENTQVCFFYVFLCSLFCSFYNLKMTT